MLAAFVISLVMTWYTPTMIFSAVAGGYIADPHVGYLPQDNHYFQTLNFTYNHVIAAFLIIIYALVAIFLHQKKKHNSETLGRKDMIADYSIAIISFLAVSTAMGYAYGRFFNKPFFNVLTGFFYIFYQEYKRWILLYRRLSKIFKWSNELFTWGMMVVKSLLGKKLQFQSRMVALPRSLYKMKTAISSVIVAGLLILVLIYICWKYVCRPKPVLQIASTANSSTPAAVTCLPDVKVVKPSATTQPPPVSGDLKQGQKPAPIPLSPVSKDLKRVQKPAPIPLLPVPAVEEDLPAVPSDKLLATDDGDEDRLAPNTIEITSREKKRRKNHRMLRAVDDDEKQKPGSKK
uniref:Uncharacterized protein n=1 Tax=Ditylenchus dipsaci TaxID=166011 RepID=A0A915DSG5_9BILA